MDLFAFFYMPTSRPALFAKDAFFFSIVYFWLLYQKSSVHKSIDLLLILQFNPFDCLFLCQYHIFYCYFSVIQLEIREDDASRRSFIVPDCFSYPVVFVFPYEMDYCSFKIRKSCVGILIEITLNLKTALV